MSATMENTKMTCKPAAKMVNSSITPSMTIRLLCRFMLIALVLSVVFYDLASAASKKFIKGFILGALLAKNHYPVVVHESHGKHKGY